jgi:hypothetical protein
VALGAAAGQTALGLQIKASSTQGWPNRVQPSWPSALLSIPISGLSLARELLGQSWRAVRFALPQRRDRGGRRHGAGAPRRGAARV